MSDEPARQSGRPNPDRDALALLDALLTEAPAATVVVVRPNDTIGTVAARIYATGAARIELLFPPEHVEFRQPTSFSTLRSLLAEAGIAVSVVTVDPAIAAAARRGQVSAVTVEPPVRTVAADPPVVATPANRAAEPPTLPATPANRAAEPPTLPAARRSPDVAVLHEAATLAQPRRDASRDADTAPSRIQRNRRSALIGTIVALGMMLAGGAGWLSTQRTTVAIVPPRAATEQHAFDGEVLPVAAALPQSDVPTVQARALNVAVTFSVRGTVQAESMVPTGRAQGIVTIINTLEQPVELPQGTDLIASGADGGEIRFMLDQAVTVPAAVTSSDASGLSTTYGSLEVMATARVAGSTGNVPRDAITRIAIPGQQPIVTDRSNLLIRHEAITGGSEELRRAVSDAAIQPVLGEALTGLYRTALDRLQQEIGDQAFTLDPETIAPTPERLAQPDGGVTVTVAPEVGGLVADDGAFDVTVSATFSALATPTDAPVRVQLQRIVPQHLVKQVTLVCQPSALPAFVVDAWRWDGSELSADGVMSCTTPSQLSDEMVVRMHAALLGMTRTEARDYLETLQSRGMIAGYTLPDVERLPDLDWLLTVQVAGA
jgi:hypothetical protein